MLALSFNQPQGYSFGSPKMPISDSTSTGALSQPVLRAPNLTNPVGPRRSLMPQGARRPKLSLQTAILPQPVSPALPLPCSADTPTTRNTLANSFRSPLPGTEGAQSKTCEPHPRESASVPYGPESTCRGILKNTPLAKLIRSRREEKERRKARHGQVRITFADEPQVIPGPQHVEFDSDEEVDITPKKNGQVSSDACSEEGRAEVTCSRSQNTEWQRLRNQRSANEGRELRSACRLSGRSGASTSSCPSLESPKTAIPLSITRDDSPNRVPETPETPSPRVTRDWVWTLGDDFNKTSASTSPQVKRTQAQNAQRSQRGSGAGNIYSPPALSKLTTVIRRSGALPDTPSTATPVTPMSPQEPSSNLPDTPVTPGSATADAAAVAAAVGKQTTSGTRPAMLKIKIAQTPQRGFAASPLTPRSVPLPETPRFGRI